MRIARSLLAVPLALSLTLAACGGGSATTTAAVSDAKAKAVAKVAGASDLSSSCVKAASAMAAAMSGAITGTDVGPASKELEAVATKAPQAVKDDIAVITAAFADVAKAMKDAGYDPSKPGTMPADSAKFASAMAAVGARFNDTKVTGASQRIQAWFDGKCSSG